MVAHNTANVQELEYNSKTGQYMDTAGNPIVVQPQINSPYAPLFYTDRGHEVVKYADVFPGPSNVHENAALTNLAVRFEVDEGVVIGQKIAPVLNTKHRSDVFYKVDTGQEAIRNPSDGEDKREVGVAAREIKQGFTTDNFAVENYALRDFLPDDTVNNADEALEMLSSSTRFLTSTLLYRSDCRLLQNVLAAANFTNATMTALSGGGKIGAATETDRFIQLALRAGRKAVHDQNMMKQSNTLVISSDVASRIASSTELISVAKHQIGAQYIAEGGWRGENWGLPNSLYGTEIVVANHIENTAAKGQTSAISDVLTDNMILLNVEAPSRRTRNAVTTFRNGEGVRVRTYRDDARKGVWVEAELIEDRHITNSLGGYVITDCV